MDANKLEEIIAAMEQEKPYMFHPIHRSDKTAWYPGNDAARAICMISNAWEDILCLMRLRKSTESEYDKRLVFKYMLVELRSIIDIIPDAQASVMKIIDGGNDSSNGYIPDEKFCVLRSLFKKYSEVKGAVQDDLNSIRNKIGAHRDKEFWRKTDELWRKLEPEKFQPLFDVIHELHEELRQLDIYTWTRIPEEEAIEIYQSGQSSPEKQAALSAALSSAHD